MNRLSGFLCGICAAGMMWADAGTHPNMSGTWQLDAAKSTSHSGVPNDMVLVIDEKDDGTIHLTESSAATNHKADFQCTTHGQDCEVKEEGKPAKVSFWYNGPLLVETEMRGHNSESITKKRMKLSSDGATLSVEVEHLVPSGAPETLVLHKRN